MVEKGARVKFHNVSQFRVDLVWENAVTYDSAARLIMLATERQSDFEILAGQGDVEVGRVRVLIGFNRVLVRF